MVSGDRKHTTTVKIVKDGKIVTENTLLCSVDELFDISSGLSTRPLSGLSYPLVLCQGMHLPSKAIMRSAMTLHLTITIASSTYEELFQTSIMSLHQLVTLVATLRRYVSQSKIRAGAKQR